MANGFALIADLQQAIKGASEKDFFTMGKSIGDLVKILFFLPKVKARTADDILGYNFLQGYFRINKFDNDIEWKKVYDDISGEGKQI